LQHGRARSPRTVWKGHVELEMCSYKLKMNAVKVRFFEGLG
jgi:hypothetical protein